MKKNPTKIFLKKTMFTIIPKLCLNEHAINYLKEKNSGYFRDHIYLLVGVISTSLMKVAIYHEPSFGYGHIHELSHIFCP